MANTNTEHAPVTLDSLIALAGAAGQDAVKPEQETAGCDNCTTCDCESTIPPDAEAPEVASPVVAEAVASAEDENQEPISIDFVQAVDQRPRGNRRAAPVNPAMAEKLASALLSTNAAVAAAAEQTVAEAVRQAADAPATVRADRPNQKSKRRQRPDVAVAPAPDATAVPQATQQRTWLWSRGEHRKLLEAGNGELRAPVVISVMNAQRFIKVQPGFARPVLTVHPVNGTLTGYLVAAQDTGNARRSLVYYLLGTNAPLNDLASSDEVSFRGTEELRFSVASVALKGTTAADASKVSLVSAQRISVNPDAKPTPVVFGTLVIL